MPEGPQDDPSVLVARLYDEHGAALFRYAAILLGDPAAAEDAVHQVFAALLRTRKPAGGIRDDAHYLRRAVRNECYLMLRRRVIRAEATVALESVEDARGQRDPGERVALERAIGALSAEQREVIHLHVFEGLTFREIASATEESINTIAGRYRYALGRLREVLNR